jgi:DNA-binding HxlR family transcriptional regulator
VNTLPPCGCAQPGAAEPETCYCSVEDLLQIIRRRYSLSVLRILHAHPHARYHEIAEGVTEASSSTLAETLRALESARLLRRDLAADGRPGYGLTASGEKLLSRLRRLLEEVQAS